MFPVWIHSKKVTFLLCWKTEKNILSKSEHLLIGYHSQTVYIMFVTLTICGCVGLQMKKGFVLCGLRLFLWVIHIRHSFVVNGAAESAEQLQRGKFHCIFMLHLLCAAHKKKPG